MFQGGYKCKISYPYSLSQHKVVERCNKYVVETGLIIMLRDSVQMKFWDYNFKSDVYLINHMPIEILDNLSSFEMLSQKAKLQLSSSVWMLMLSLS